MPLRRFIVLVAIPIAALIAIIRLFIVTPAAKPELASGRPDCPHDYAGRGADSLVIQIVGPRSEVPEFHDCQRLIQYDSSSKSLRYGALAAVFAHPLVGTYTDASFDTIRPVALVHFPQGGSYETLNLRATNNCIWLHREKPEVLVAHVTEVTHEAECLEARTISPTSFGGLDVRVHPPAEGLNLRLPVDVPAVARWDWDDDGKSHFIGVRCGSAWCEIGAAQFGDSEDHLVDKSEKAGEFPGLLVKGSYDEQLVAEFNPDGSLIVGRNRGTVFPLASLEEFSSGDQPPIGRWVPVAEVNMHRGVGSYGDQLNLIGNDGPLVDGQRATISLCSGTLLQCLPHGFRVFNPFSCKAQGGRKWYARIDNGAGRVRYFCVIYRPHPEHFDVPSVVRWRWRPDDETFWVRCPAGCCEVNVS